MLRSTKQKKILFRNHNVAWCFYLAIIRNRDKAAIPCVYVWCLSSVSELPFCRSVPKSPISPRNRWDGVVLCPSCRTAYICPCPSVGFYATWRSWVYCESPYTMLTWLHQATLLCGDWPNTSDQSMAGWSCMMRTSLVFVTAVYVVRKVSDTLRLKARPVSACLWGSICAHSWKQMRKYSKVRGIAHMCGGGVSVLGDNEVRTLSHSAVSDPLLSPWVRNLTRKRALHLVTTAIRSKSPSSVPRCKVDRDTLNIAPRHVPGYCC